MQPLDLVVKVILKEHTNKLFKYFQKKHINITHSYFTNTSPWL